jgi:hypothetical protein
MSALAPKPLDEIACDMCGVTPCASMTFCKTCKLVDSRNRAKPTEKRARRPTPVMTIEAIMIAVRLRGIGALREPANLERLSRCDDRAKDEVNRRIDVLFQKGMLK